jgi:DNA-binding transcriptional LysR family regulator
MKLEHLAAFVAVADERHFGRAAATLLIGTPSLSKRLSELERSLGFRLFERSSRNVTLTPAAMRLLEPARRTLLEARRFEDLAGEVAAGTGRHLRIAHAMNHYPFATDLLAATRCRRGHLEATLHELPPTQIAPMVAAGDASLGLCWGELPSGLASFTFEVLKLDVILVPEGHRLANRKQIDVDELEGEPILCGNGTEPSERWRPLGVHIQPVRVDIRSRLDFTTRIEAGECLVLAASSSLARFRHRAVVPVRLRDPETWVEIDQLLVWRADDPDPLITDLLATAKELANAGWRHPGNIPVSRAVVA